MAKLGVNPQEESEPRQHAGLCPRVSVGDGGYSASGSQALSIAAYVLARKGLCGQNPHQKIGNPAMGEYIDSSCQKWEGEE